MHAVVNLLRFSEPLDPQLFVAGRDELEAKMRGVPGFEALHVVQTGENEAFLVIVADRAETLDRLATEVGGPWMVEHVVPRLAGPPSRSLGEIIVSTQYT